MQALFDGLYFLIPQALEHQLVPASSEAIRIEVQCEWTDYSTARSWGGVTQPSDSEDAVAPLSEA